MNLNQLIQYYTNVRFEKLISNVEETEYCAVYTLGGRMLAFGSVSQVAAYLNK